MEVGTLLDRLNVIETTVEKKNTIINAADIGKDASQHGYLSRQHDFFLMTRVNPLFKNNVPESIWNNIGGLISIENNKKIINKYIFPNFDNKIKRGVYEGDSGVFIIGDSGVFIIQRRLINSTNSANGEVLTIQHSNIVEDGIKMVSNGWPNSQHKGTHCKRIFTPGDIFDTMKNDKPSTYLLPSYISTAAIDSQYTLSNTDFKSFGLSNLIRELKFVPPKNNEFFYSFHIKTTIENYENKTYRFDDQTFKPHNEDIFCGNRKKNKFILDNFQDTAKLPDIQFRILVKLLGDLLKVVYLKGLINKKKLPRENTYISTADKNVHFRALLNGIQTINNNGRDMYSYTLSKNTTDIISNEIHLLLDMIHRQYINKSNNIKKFAILINKKVPFTVESHYPYNLKIVLPQVEQEEFLSQIEELQKELDTTYNTIKEKLRSFKINDIRNTNQTEKDIYEIRKYISNSQITPVFIVQLSTRDGTVLPKIKFFQETTSTLLKYLEKFGEATQVGFPEARSFYFPPPVPETYTGPIEPRPFKFPEGGGSSGKMNTSPEKSEAKSDIGDYLKANKEHGFFAFFVITYLPNVLLTSYAYAMTTDVDYKKFNRFFGEDTIRMCEIFGKPYDYVFDSYGEGRKEDDELMRELCSIGSAAYKQRGDFSIFDYADDDTREFFTIIDGKHRFKEYANSLAKDTYQALYYAEVSRVILNQPSNGDPLKVEGSASQMNVITPTKLSKSGSKSKKSGSKSKKSGSKTKTLKSKLTQYIRPVAKRTKSAWSRKPVLKTIVPRTQTRKIVA